MFEFWLILAVLLMVLEVVLGFTVVLFFSGLACFTVAALIYFGYIELNSIVAQFAAFFLATTIWTIVLWKPFRTLVKKLYNSDATATNILGQEAIIANGPLRAGKIGLVAWSGTVVKAKLDTNSKHRTLEAGTTVIVIAIKDNIFIVKEIS